MNQAKNLQDFVSHCDFVFEILEEIAKRVFERISTDLVPGVTLLSALTDVENEGVIHANLSKSFGSSLAKRIEFCNSLIAKEPSLVSSFLPKERDNFKDGQTNEGRKTFSSEIIEIEDGEAILILDFPEKKINQVSSLPRNFCNQNVAQSILESTIIEVFEHFKEMQAKFELGLSYSFFGEEILKRAGVAFLETIVNVVNNEPKWFDLYNKFCEISNLKYESKSSVGNILLYDVDHSMLDFSITFKEKIIIDQSLRKIRKLLEISSPEAMLVLDGKFVYGFGKLKQGNDVKPINAFEVNFYGHQLWDLKFQGNLLMRVKNGIPTIQSIKIEPDEFCLQMAKVFGEEIQAKPYDFYDLVRALSKEKGGAVLVISSDAKGESIRLGGQGFEIKPPFRLNAQNISTISKIDGAVLIDTSLNCWAFGVILDGIAIDRQMSTEQDSSRGARYNSSKRYVETISDRIKTLVVVISEDGMIDLISKEVAIEPSQ